LTPNKLILTFRGSYVCANFCETDKKCDRDVLADGQTHRQTHTHTHTPSDANRFYNLSHAICYSYGTDKNTTGAVQSSNRAHLDDFCNWTVTSLTKYTSPVKILIKMQSVSLYP